MGSDVFSFLNKLSTLKLTVFGKIENEMLKRLCRYRN